MQLSLAQFLLALTANFTQGLSAEAGIVTLESGDTFDVKANAKELHTMLSCASHDLRDAHNKLVEFVSNQSDDKPYYDDTRTQLTEYRRDLEALNLYATSAPAATAATNSATGMKVSIDGGVTYQPAVNGVRIIYEDVAVRGENELGQLHISATREGIMTDVWVSRDEHLDHNIGCESVQVDSLVNRLVEENT